MKLENAPVIEPEDDEVEVINAFLRGEDGYQSAYSKEEALKEIGLDQLGI